ncbi:thiamine phosphate synthase [Hydrogenimonas sp. SS33]|uniref:thiamine phosphate synthase n=1 Tax=Hydrogenimonas leucolamina TaxID=2954236 RepID=UPI00336BB2DE
MKKLPLYALLDEDSLQNHGWSVERFVRRANDLGAELLQYRNKSGDVDLIRRRLETIVPLFEGRVIVNDHPELAPLCGGVHVGQEDLETFGPTPEEAVAVLRETVGFGRWIGLSTHNAEEIEAANDLQVDYIGLGAYRATPTKSDANVLGEAELPKLAARSRHPVAAIGGVRIDDTIAHVRWLVVGSGLYED